MTDLTYTRTILALSGPDAESFLQGIATQDIRSLGAGGLHFTSFLSPQGKLLFDAFLWREGNTIFIDSDAGSTEALSAFLLRYKLRAKVTCEPTDLTLTLLPPTAQEGFTDPRVAILPRRLYHPSSDHRSSMIGASDYHATRIAHAVPEASFDSRGEDVAMDLGYDLLHAISFTKGCYVGQEVTARMHYKQVIRKAVLHVMADAPLETAFSTITAGPLTLGTLRSFHKEQGLAVVRLDTWQEALISIHRIECGGTPVQLAWPDWASAKEEAWRQGKLVGDAQI